MARIFLGRERIVKRRDTTSLRGDHTCDLLANATFSPKRRFGEIGARPDLCSASARRLHWLSGRLRFMPKLRSNSPFLKRSDENEAGK
jgi:hypothetical protein